MTRQGKTVADFIDGTRWADRSGQMTGPSAGINDARKYQEAISQWQLAARTEVKKFSSLPSAMFDTCDPMLEACLADSVETMMHRLHEPEIVSLAEMAENHTIEIRVEKVTSEELRELRSLKPENYQHLDLEFGISTEYLSLLIDSCTTGDEPTQAAARELLRRDFGVETGADLQQATETIFACLQRVLDDASCERDYERIAELCSTIASSVISANHLQQEDS